MAEAGCFENSLGLLLADDRSQSIPPLCPKVGICLRHHLVERRRKATYRTVASNVPSICFISPSGIVIPNSTSRFVEQFSQVLGR